jgi:transcriptional regulator with XRE-family HTH domain
MSWVIRSDELRRRRLEKIMTIAELARLSIVSVRTIHSLEKSDIAVSVTTVDCLAKVLGCQRADIATSSDKRPKTIPPKKIDDAKPRAPSVLKYNQCFTAYAARHGERYAIEGTVEHDHGLPPAEAALLGASSGKSARFEMRVPVGDDGHSLCVTVHTDCAATTIEMQDAAHKTTLCIVRLVALDDLAAGAGLTFFMRERPSPWCFVVERVVRVAPRRRVATAPKKAPRRARR